MTKIMVIPKKLHGFMIGRESATLRCILQDITEVSVRFPDKDVESDIVTIHWVNGRRIYGGCTPPPLYDLF